MPYFYDVQERSTGHTKAILVAEDGDYEFVYRLPHEPREDSMEAIVRMFHADPEAALEWLREYYNVKFMGTQYVYRPSDDNDDEEDEDEDDDE